MRQLVMRLSLAVPLVVAAGLGLAGCGEEEKAPHVDCAANTSRIPAFGQVTIWPTCTSCHSSSKTGAARNKAPTDINFDAYDSAKAHAKQASIQVNEGAMPNDKTPVTDEQKQSLYLWALCGTPQ